MKTTIWSLTTLCRLFNLATALLLLPALPAAGQTILTNGLVAYYPLNGNANDASGNGNNGMVSGATLTTDRFGNQNSAYSFDGISNVITIPDFAGADANAHTISAWIKAITPPWVTILGKDGLGRQWVCQWYQTGQNAASIRWAVFTSTGEYDLDSNAQLQTNQWYQIVTVWDGTNQSQFVNGVFDSSMSAPGTLAQHTQPVRIGGGPGEGFFDGIIGDVRIYNRALSSNEVGELYAFEAQAHPPTGCALFYRPTDTISINGFTTVTNQMTIEAEILIPSSLSGPTDGPPRIFEEELCGGKEKQLWASPSVIGGGTWVFDNQTPAVSASNSAGRNSWHHLAFVHDFNEERVYLDGLEVGTLDFAGDPSIANTSSGGMSIGAFLYACGNGQPTPSFLGAIQWVRVSSVARYSGPSVLPPVTVPESDPYTQILFDFTRVAPGTSTVYDLSPNHFIGTVGVGFSGATSPSFVLPAPPTFQAVSETNGSLTLSWNTVAGLVYQAQFTTNLSPASWNDFGYPLVATNGIVSINDTTAIDTQRFYRVIQTQ